MTEERNEDARPGEEDHLAATRRAVLAAALPYVAFDGWTDRTLAHAVEDAGVDAGALAARLPARRRRPGARLPQGQGRGARREAGRRRPARAALPRPDRARHHAPARAGRRRPRGGPARRDALRAAAPRRRRRTGDLAHRRHHLDRARRRRAATSPGTRSARRSRRSIPRRCSTGSATTAPAPRRPASSWRGASTT